MKADVDQQKEIRRRVAATERMRRFRKRQDAGIAIVPTPCNDDIVALLVDLNQLAMEKSEDPVAIGEAIFRC